MVEVQDIDRKPTRPPTRRRLLVAATAGLLLLAILWASIGGDSGRVELVTPEAVAEAFMASWTAGDGDAVAALFAPEGKFDGYGPEILPPLHDWYRAVGQVFTATGCAPRPAGGLFCAYVFENDLTRALGRDSVRGSFQLLEIDGGRIERAHGFTDQYVTDGYDITWEAFSEWVERNHGEDWRRMYSFGSYPVLLPTSISLWEQHVDEFAASPGVASPAVVA